MVIEQVSENIDLQVATPRSTDCELSVQHPPSHIVFDFHAFFWI
jgi:hypothetical protein